MIFSVARKMKLTNPKTTRKMAVPGNVANHHASGRYCRLSEMASPHSGSGGVAPMPRKPSAAAERIVNPIPMVARTMIGGAAFGRMCRNITRSAPALSPSSASTKTDTRMRRVSAKTMRVKNGQ